MKLSPILIAEDNPNDALLLRKAFEDNHAVNPIVLAENGQEAIDFLLAEGRFKGREFPALFLLDLRMPVKDGLEVLQWLSEHPEIPEKLPVVVLSSAEVPERVQIEYAKNIQACLVKPAGYPELRERIRILKEYWLDYVACADGAASAPAAS